MGGVAGMSIAHDQLRSFFERIERLHEERQAIGDDIKEVFAEARSNGFDTKVMKIVLQKRRMDSSERLEQEALVELYMTALGMSLGPDEADANDEPSAHVHVHARAHVREGEESQPTPVVQEGSEPAEAHNLGSAGSTPAPATNPEAADPFHADPPRSGAATGNEAVTAASGPDWRLPPPEPRRPYCLNPGSCAASTREHCYGCTKAHEAQAAHDGAAA